MLRLQRLKESEMGKLPDSLESVGVRQPDSEDSTFHVIFRFTDSDQALKWLEDVLTKSFKE